VAGAIDEDSTLKGITETFGNEEGSNGNTLHFPPAMPPREANQVREMSGDVEHVYGVLGTVGYPVEDDRSIALDVLMKIFGGGQTSRLHENLVLKQQLASSLSASFWTQRETGPVMIHLQTEEDQVEQLVPAIRKEADRIAREGVTDEELSRAKTQLKTGFIYSSQTPTGQANQIGYWHTIENVEYLEDYIERIEEIDRETIQAVADEILVDQNWTGVLLHPDGEREPVKAP
jgi:zinc protease